MSAEQVLDSKHIDLSTNKMHRHLISIVVSRRGNDRSETRVSHSVMVKDGVYKKLSVYHAQSF